MNAVEVAAETRKDRYRKLNGEIFGYKFVKPLPSEWVEANIVLPSETSRYSGHFSYDWSPYMRQIVNHLHPGDPTRYVSVMKCVQSGATQGLVVPGICYIIANAPDPILFTGADKIIAKKTMNERLDPIIRASGLLHLIRPNVVKKQNNRSGDTAEQKEFAGGVLTAAGTGNADSFRFYSVRYAFPDDFDTAPRDLGDEGSVKELIEGRQNSYGESAKTFFVSTPTVLQYSNIHDQYLMGTQNKWNWPCPECSAFFPLDFKQRCFDGTLAGMVWELDKNNKLIIDSVYLKCPHCGHKIEERQKFDLNLKGCWISTVEEAKERLHESYLIPAIAVPPGFIGWVKLVEKWLEANPPGEKAIVPLLKTFNNLYLGLPFAESGDEPVAKGIMLNTRNYDPGLVPDSTCEHEGNGKLVFISLSIDINGIMNQSLEDVRVDWEILGHNSRGGTYSIDHGSIGTFKRERSRTFFDKQTEDRRMKWTLRFGSTVLQPADPLKGETGPVHFNNCVWPELEKIMRGIYKGESGRDYSINVSLIDTGFGEKYAMQFVNEMQAKGVLCYGIKGRVDDNYRSLKRDNNPITRSKEAPRQLYIVEVNQVKEDLSELMKLKEGEDGSQPAGFMNFPQSGNRKYDYKGYFIEFEGEHRIEVKNKGGEVIGYQWKKKNADSRNHFWDVRVYGMAAPLVFLDVLKQSDPNKYKAWTWEDVVVYLLSRT